MEYVQSKIDTFSLPVRIYYSPYIPIRMTVLTRFISLDITNKLRRNETSWLRRGSLPSGVSSIHNHCNLLKL